MKFLTKLLLLLFLFNNIHFSFGNVEPTSTGSLENIPSEETEEIFSEDVFIDVPIPIIDIQSGLEDGDGEDMYLCKKEDCKVNLTVEDSFIGEYDISEFTCEWDFGGGTWTTANTETKCNPGYVAYINGEYTISIKIIDENNADNFKESSIQIQNSFDIEIEIPDDIEIPDESEESTLTGEILTESSSGVIVEDDSGSGAIETSGTGEIQTGTGFVEEEILNIPDIVFEVQSGIEQNGTGSVYTCKKEDCKVNLTVENLFTGSHDQSDFQCDWTFGSGTYTDGTEAKCNPGYITYGTGAHEIGLKLSEKTNSGNFLTGSITVLNGIDYDFWLTGSGETTSTGDIIDVLTGSIVDETEYIEVVSEEEEEETPESFINENLSVLVHLQQPSYVTGVGDSFHCDQEKEECKVNFKFTILEELIETSDYTCQITTSLDNETLESCNPTTKIFPKGESSIQITIYDKENENLVYEKEIIITNEGYIDVELETLDNSDNSDDQIIETPVIETTSTGEIIDVSTGSIVDETEYIEVISEEEVEEKEVTPENFINDNISILVNLQQPSYVTGVGDSFHCDQEKEECKVNFEFTILEELVETSDYTCQIITSLDNEILESCNPTTKIFPEGESSIQINIYDKENENLVYEKEIIITNEGYQESVVQSNNSVEIVEVEEKIEDNTEEEKLSISLGEIEIQSGLDENNYCKKSDCKVNLKYSEEKGEKCEWSFPGGEYDENTKYKCNPGYVDYPEYGAYIIQLKVYDENHDNNFKIQKISFSNVSEDEKTDEDMIGKEEIVKEDEIIDYVNFETDFVIDLQGRASANKIFSGATIFCYVEPCNINLDGSNSQRSNGEKVVLYWQLGENTFEGNNPKALWFNSGSHLISIQDGENRSDITLIVDKNAIKLGDENQEENQKIVGQDQEIEIDENILTYLKISAVSPNPKGVDTHEYIEIENIGNAPLNLLGVILDDITDGGSKPYMIDEAIILQPGEKMKWYKYDTKINLNNNQDSVNLSYDNTIIDSLNWNYDVADNYIITHKNSGIATQEVEIIRIIDGDTIQVRLENGEIETIQLLGVDTPEIYNTSGLEWYYGNIASTYTRLSLLGKTLTLEVEELYGRDTNGNILGYIYLENGELFNENLIRKGYSRAYLVDTFKYSKLFKSAESLAKKEDLIIWGDSDYKKIVNNFIKNDKVLITNSEQYNYKIAAENFYVDTDNNNIPDSFQISIHNGEETIYSTGSMERYDNFIQNSFHINVSKLNAGVKISGKTIPNAELTFKILDTIYITTSDNSGDFSLSIGADFLVSEYSVNSYIRDIYGNSFTIEETKEFEITKEYLEKLANIEKERLQKEAEKRAKALAKELKRLQKLQEAAKGKIYSSIFIKQAQAYQSIKSTDSYTSPHTNILTFLLIILSLFMFFFILKRKKLL